MILRYLFFFVSLFLISCVNDLDEVDAYTTSMDTSIDIGEEVKIIYSDSGLIKVIIEGPVLEKHNKIRNPKEVFPEGIFVTFLDEGKEATSWLEGDHAVRDGESQKMIVQGNVSFYNKDNEKLQSSELIWDEKTGLIYTDKFVKITRPLQKDTIYGLGFETDQSFDKITIKHAVKSKLNTKKLNFKG